MHISATVNVDRGHQVEREHRGAMGGFGKKKREETMI